MQQKTFEMLVGIQYISMKYENEINDIELENKICKDVKSLLSVMYGDNILSIIDIVINPAFFDKCRVENLFINKKTGKRISDINELEDLIYGNIKLKLDIDYDKYIVM